MKKILFVITLFILACSSEKKETPSKEDSAQKISRPDFKSMIGKDFLIDDQHSYIGFRIKYFGSSNVRGRFDKFKGTAFYNPETGFISATLIIDANSINTGDKRRDEDLKQGAWFETAQFPTIIFSTTGTASLSDGLELQGELQVKDFKRVVSVKLEKPGAMTKDWAGNDQVDFVGSFTISRSEFGVKGDGLWNEVMENGVTQLADEVSVEVEIHARRADYLVRKKNPELIDSVASILLHETVQQGFEVVVGRILTKKAGEIERSTLYDFGYTLMSEGKYKEAKQIFNTLAKLYPEKINDQNLLGICYLLEGEEQQAKLVFSKVITRDSLNTKGMEYLKHIN
jgi:polyisoprenoid-binding protein YceI